MMVKFCGRVSGSSGDIITMLRYVVEFCVHYCCMGFVHL